MKNCISHPKYFLSPNEIFLDGVSAVPVDDEGVAMWNYKGYLGLHKQYNPSIIASYALSMYNLYYDTLNRNYFDKFIINTDFLVKTLVERGTYGVWLYEFPWVSPCYVCEPPWVSGLAQGLGISVMVRAWMLTKKSEYFLTAKKALASFKVPVSKGGVLKIDKNGFWWYDEYCCQQRVNVLNGFLFALIGIHDYCDITKDPSALSLLAKGSTTVERYISTFDLNLLFFKWSKYDDALLFYSGTKYHDLHVKQLVKLYEITRNETFRTYAIKWSAFQKRYDVLANCKILYIMWATYTRMLKLVYAKVFKY